MKASVGVNDALAVGAATPFSGAAVMFTNVDPQDIESCCAAEVYVLLSGWVTLLAKFA